MSKRACAHGVAGCWFFNQANHAHVLDRRGRATATVISPACFRCASIDGPWDVTSGLCADCTGRRLAAEEIVVGRRVETVNGIGTIVSVEPDGALRVRLDVSPWPDPMIMVRAHEIAGA
jgi:hypothetical protein